MSLLLGPGTVSAHALPGALPPGSEYAVRWFQHPDDHQIQDWDIEITPFDSDEPPSIITAQPFPDQASCWVAPVLASGPARVRVRAVQDGMVSEWSAYTAVPEPGFALTLAAGVGGLVHLRRRRRGDAA